MYETIYALASAQGKAGVAVIRISGPKALKALGTLTNKPAPKPRMAKLSRLFHPISGETLDDALILAFKAPASFTSARRFHTGI